VVAVCDSVRPVPKQLRESCLACDQRTAAEVFAIQPQQVECEEGEPFGRMPRLAEIVDVGYAAFIRHGHFAVEDGVSDGEL
jgi:hypothetical protein